MNSFRDIALKFGSYLLVFFLPFVYFGTNILYPHIISKTFFFYGVVDVLIGFWLYAMVVDKSYRPSKNTLFFTIPVFLYLLWMTIAGMLAVNPELAFWSSLARGTGLLTLYHSFFFLLIVASLVKKNGIKYVYDLMQWFINGSFFLIVSVWFGSGGFNLPLKFLQTDGGGGLAGNSSLAAGYLLFVLAMGLFLLITGSVSNKLKYWILFVLTSIIFSPLFIDVHGFFVNRNLLGNARGALIGIIVAVLVAFSFWLCLSPKKILKIFGGILVVIGFIIFSFGWKQLVTPNTYLHQKFTEVASGTRFIFWDTAQKAMKDHPWLGYGPDNYMIAFEQYFNPKMLLPQYNYEGWNDRAHNIYYDTGVAGGYPAIILYSLFVLSILYALYKSKEAEAISSIQISILMGALAGYIFQDLFYFDSVISMAALFALAGVSYALVDFTVIKDTIKKEKNIIKFIDPFYRNILVIMLFGICSFLFIYFSYMPEQKAKAYADVLGTPFNKNFDKLLKGSPVGNAWDVSGIAHDTNNMFAKDPLGVKNNTKVLPYVLKDLSAMLSYLEEIANNNKTDFRLYISMVRLYNARIYLDNTFNTKQTRDHMLELLEQARTLSPTNPEVYWAMAQVYAWQGDQKAVEDAYQKSIDIDPSIPTSHTFFLKFLMASGNKKLYKEELLRAEENIPGFKL